MLEEYSRQGLHNAAPRVIGFADRWVITAYCLICTGMATILAQLVFLRVQDPDSPLYSNMAGLLVTFEGTHIGLSLIIAGFMLLVFRTARIRHLWRILTYGLGAAVSCSLIATTIMGMYNSIVNMQHLASQYEAAASLHDPAALTQARSKVLAYVYDHAGSTSHKLRALRLMADEANPITDNGIFGWIHYARTSDGIRMAKYRV